MKSIKIFKSVEIDRPKNVKMSKSRMKAKLKKCKSAK